MRPQYALLFVIVLLLSCKKTIQPPLDPISVETRWAINIFYRDAITGEPVIGKGRTFPLSYLHIYKKAENDTGYTLAFDGYSQGNAKASDRNIDDYPATLEHIIYTPVESTNQIGNTGKAVATKERFNISYAVELKHAADTLTDTFIMVKTTDDEFELYRYGNKLITAPSPTKHGKEQHLILLR